MHTTTVFVRAFYVPLLPFDIVATAAAAAAVLPACFSVYCVCTYPCVYVCV